MRMTAVTAEKHRWLKVTMARYQKLLLERSVCSGMKFNFMINLIHTSKQSINANKIFKY